MKNSPDQLESALPSRPLNPRRWLRYSMRTLLVTVTLACIWLGTVVNRAEQQRQTVAALRALGNQVEYDTPYTHPRGEPSNWRWLRSWIGDDYLDDVTYVSLRHGVDSELLRLVSQLRGLKRLDVSGANAADAAMAVVASLPKLEILAVQSHELTDEGLQSLSRMRNLRALLLHAPLVTDRGAVFTSNLGDLERLSLFDTQITDEGVESLCTMTNLSKLGIGQQSRSLKQRLVTDRGVQHICHLSKLTELSLHGSRITDQGLMQLASLQNLRRLHVECFRPEYSLHGVKSLQEKLPGLAIRHSAWEQTWQPVMSESNNPVFDSPARRR